MRRGLRRGFVGVMKAFIEVIGLVGLVDVGMICRQFTWSNMGEGDACTRVRLDRGFRNLAWKTFF